MYTITVCGGGNAAHVMLGLLGSRSDVSVRLFDTLPDEVEKIQSELQAADGKMTVYFKDGREPLRGVIDQISTQAEEVIPGSDMVILAVPAFAHELYMRAIEKHADPGCIVGVMVAKGGVDWQFKEIFKDKLDSVQFFAMENLPWACRIRDYGRSAEILGTKLILDVAVFSDEPDRIIDRLNKWIALGTVENPERKLPQFTLAPNFISCSLRGNLGHACIMYGKWHDWDGEQKCDHIPLFYQGVDEFTADIMEKASLEVMEIKKALVQQLGIDLDSVIESREWFIKAYGEDIADSSTLQSCIVTNKGYEGLTHAMDKVDEDYVPSRNSRYLVEDLPFGILVIKGIAEIMGVDTPVIDEVIDWNQKFMQKEYMVDGKLIGKDIPGTRVPQRFGISQPQDLVWHTSLQHQ